MLYANTQHNRVSMNRRGITQDALDFVAVYGRVTYRTGVKFIFLGRRDIPRGYERSHGHLEGTTMIIASGHGVVVTSYRNREAIREIKRKRKRTSRPLHLCA